MEDDMTPKWGVELMIRFERLEARIGTNDERHHSHAEWATRNIKDHEIRLRAIEKKLWGAVGAGLTANTPPASGGYKVTTFTAGDDTISFS